MCNGKQRGLFVGSLDIPMMAMSSSCQMDRQINRQTSASDREVRGKTVDGTVVHIYNREITPKRLDVVVQPPHARTYVAEIQTATNMHVM